MDERGNYEDAIAAVLLRIQYEAEGAGTAAAAQEWAEVLNTVTGALPEPGFCRECGENPCECDIELDEDEEHEEDEA